MDICIRTIKGLARWYLVHHILSRKHSNRTLSSAKAVAYLGFLVAIRCSNIYAEIDISEMRDRNWRLKSGKVLPSACDSMPSSYLEVSSLMSKN